MKAASPRQIANILMVDDHQENLLALDGLLKSEDRNLVKASSGNQALQELLHTPFALVLMDVQMPDMDGFETAELMRMNPVMRTIPIIFLTALNRDEKYVFRGYEAGAVDYIAKPIEPTILQSKVEIFCELYRQRVELEASRSNLLQLNHELVAQKMELNAQLKLARSVQLGFLPKEFPDNSIVRFGFSFKTCDLLGGDLFDVFSIDDQHIGFWIADISGHGVCAALISGLLKMAASRFRAPGSKPDADDLLLQPSQLLERLNSLLMEQLQPDRFISMLYGVIDTNHRQIRLASAGHPGPVFFQAKIGTAELWPSQNGPALGFLDEAVYPINALPLQTGDKMLLYTDGIIEAMNHAEEEYGADRLTATINTYGQESIKTIIHQVEQDVRAFRGSAPVLDDETLLLLHIR